jgi:hypothetical protein
MALKLTLPRAAGAHTEATMTRRMIARYTGRYREATTKDVTAEDGAR